MRVTPRRPLWTWVKVVLALIGIDLLLFRAGLFFEWVPQLRGENATTWGLLYTAIRHLEIDPQSPATAYVVGSSVLFLGVNEERLNEVLEEDRLPPRATLLTTFGATATDSALLAARALEDHPWLVVYAATARDFSKTAPLDTPVSRMLLDSSTDLPAMPAVTGEERLTLIVRRYWQLYRYRTFVRIGVWEGTTGLLARTIAGHAPPVLPPPPATAEDRLPPEALERFHFARITPEAYRAWQTWNTSRRFDDFVAWMRANKSQALDAYKTQRLASFGPQDNPQVTSLAWMLRRIRDRGARAVVVYFPENPAFRDPAAAEYFDASLSDAYAKLFADETAATGARFVDLRGLLPAEDFHDLIHPNLAGMRTLSRRLADIVAEEWRAREGGAP